MNTFKFICNQCLENSRNQAANNKELADFLNLYGISQLNILERFKIGYSQGKFKNDLFRNNLIIPFFDANREIMNITGYNILNYPYLGYNSFNPYGIFNQENLKEYQEIIVTNNPIDALFLIQYGFNNTTFIFGDYTKYLQFFLVNKCQTVISTFTGHQKLLYNFALNGSKIKQAGKINHADSREDISLMISKAIPVYYYKD